MEYVQRLGQQLGAIINNAIDNAIAGVGFLSEEEAIFLLEIFIFPLLFLSIMDKVMCCVLSRIYCSLFFITLKLIHHY